MNLTYGNPQFFNKEDVYIPEKYYNAFTEEQRNNPRINFIVVKKNRRERRAIAKKNKKNGKI